MTDLNVRMKYLLLGLMVLTLALLLPALPSAQAQEPLWQPEVLDPGPAAMPVLVVDSASAVHMLWIHLNRLDETNTGPDTVFYAQRSVDGVWSDPIDVLIAPTGMTLSGLDAVIDSQDVIHLIAVADSGLYYSRAVATQADSARDWTPWVRLSDAQAGPSAIALGSDDSLHVVYPQISTPPDSVYYIGSTDGGVSWGSPSPISTPVDPRTQPINAVIAASPSGRLHVVWAETIEAFPPSGVFHAYSDDQGQTWSQSQMIAGPGYNWISIGIEEDESRVHLIWTGTGEVVGKYHALSTDAGETWGSTDMVFYGWAGYLGRSRFALDSAGHLHLITALGGDSNSTEWRGPAWISPGDIFHSTWEGNNWLAPAHVSMMVTEPQLEHATPSLAISEGNLLHVAWNGLYLPEGMIRPVWYSSRRIDAPWVEPQPQATATSIAIPLAVPEESEAARPSADQVAGMRDRPWPESSNIESLEPSSTFPLSPLVVGLVPPILLVLVVVGFSLTRRSTR